jgi:NAD(P)-dependent dehydrogenase (short-subunit alcohol dehydrogenase family)
MRYDLQGKTVLLTGSTGGFGRALARALVARGALVSVSDLSLDAVQAQVAELGSERAAGWAADVTSFDELQRWMQQSHERFGRIDVVIANAGREDVAAVESAKPDEWDQTIAVNLGGVMRTFKAAAPWLRQTRGYALATASMASFVHSPLQSAYCASKAGVWALCDCFRLEMRPDGVGVGSLHPTFFHTPMMDRVHADDAGRLLWGGNSGLIWRTIPLELVVSEAIRGIEGRRDQIVVPGINTPVARAPGLFRRLIERLGFSNQQIRETIKLAASRPERGVDPLSPERLNG